MSFMQAEQIGPAASSRRHARVIEVEAVGDICIFNCADDERSLRAAAGAHVDVYIPDGTIRQYSLLPSGLGQLRFAVKFEMQGRGGSRFLCKNVKAGQLIEVGALRNNFALDETAPHSVLIAGGIGITPLYSMVKRLATIGASWELHYCSRGGRDALFAAELVDAYPSQVSVYAGSAGVRLNLRSVLESAAKGAHLYCCGPASLIDEFNRLSASRPPETVHVECFKGATSSTPSAPYNARLARSGKVIAVPANGTLLQALLDAGIDVPFSCRDGVCGACEVSVISGCPDHRDSVLSASERAANKTIIACCSGSSSDLLELDL